MELTAEPLAKIAIRATGEIKEFRRRPRRPLRIDSSQYAVNLREFCKRLG